MILNSKTNREVWITLEKRFTTLSRYHNNQLKNQLNNRSTKSGPMEDYLQKIRDVANELALASNPVDDEDLVLIAIGGLPDEY